jgi:hypothetical protein
LLLIALAMLFAVRHRPYENQIRTGGDLRAEQLATRVLLSAQSGPLYVISSAPPLAAHLQRRQPMMQMSQTPVIPSPDDPSKSDEWVQLAAATGTISMYDQGWNEPEALAALLQRTQGRHATVLIDSQVAPNLAKMPLGRYNLNKVVM